MTTAISNPPYNLKWEVEPFADLDSRFNLHGVPPESNANFAFLLSSMEKANRGIFILPIGVLSSSNNKEKKIVKSIIDNNELEAVILCPDKMFEMTTISTVILIINKCKKTSDTVMVDLRNSFDFEKREQKGQYGSKAHTNRVYEKNFKVLSDEIIEKTVKAIKDEIEEVGFSKCVSLEDIKSSDYNINPSNYIENNSSEKKYRDIKDIVDNLNDVIYEKNKCKLTINETLARTLGFDESLYKKEIINEQLNRVLEKSGAEKIIKDQCITFTKNAGEFKFENKSKTEISSLLLMLLNTWKQHIYYLNNRENIYLAELRDVLISKLISGEIEVQNDN